MNYLAMASRALGAPKNRRMRYRRLPTTRPIPETPPGADLPPKKVCNLGPMAPRSRKKPTGANIQDGSLRSLAESALTFLSPLSSIFPLRILSSHSMNSLSVIARMLRQRRNRRALSKWPWPTAVGASTSEYKIVFSLPLSRNVRHRILGTTLQTGGHGRSRRSTCAASSWEAERP